MPVIKRKRVSRVNPQSAWLAAHRRNIRSQFGEDGVIAQVFQVIGTQNRWCVEFGAFDGEYLSNTWALIAEAGWSAVLIEGDATRAAALQALHQGKDHIHTISAFVGWQGDTALGALLSRTPIPAEFDLLSIDIDGNDWHVWKSLTTHRPRVVVVEFNPTMPNDVVFIQDADPAVNQGCSLLALIELGKEKGYELVATTLCNAIFVQADLFPAFGIADNSIDAMHDCTSDLALFHGFDGTVFGAGTMRLIWSDVTIAQEDLQILPKSLRRYQG